MTDPASGASSANNAMESALKALYQNQGAIGKEQVKDIIAGTGLASSHSLETLGDELMHQNPSPVTEKHTVSSVNSQDLSKLSTSDKAKEKFYNILTKISNLWSSFVSKFTSSHDKNYIIDLSEIAEEAEKLGEEMSPPPSTAQEDAPAPTEPKALKSAERPASGRRDSVELKNDLQEFLYDSGDRYTLLLADQAKENALPAFKEKFSQAKTELELSIKEADDYINGKSASAANPEAIKTKIKSKIDNIKSLIKASEQARVESHGDRINEMKDFQSALQLSQTRISNKLNDFYMRLEVDYGKHKDSTRDQLRIIDAANARCKSAVQRATDAQRKYENGDISSIDQSSLQNDIDREIQNLDREIASVYNFLNSLSK